MRIRFQMARSCQMIHVGFSPTTLWQNQFNGMNRTPGVMRVYRQLPVRKRAASRSPSPDRANKRARSQQNNSSFSAGQSGNSNSGQSSDVKRAGRKSEFYCSVCAEDEGVNYLEIRRFPSPCSLRAGTLRRHVCLPVLVCERCFLSGESAQGIKDEEGADMCVLAV